MSSFKCTFCDCTFDSLTGLTLYTNKCPLSADDINKNLTFSKTTESFRNTLNLFESTENIKKKILITIFLKISKLVALDFAKNQNLSNHLMKKKNVIFKLITNLIWKLIII